MVKSISQKEARQLALQIQAEADRELKEERAEESQLLLGDQHSEPLVGYCEGYWDVPVSFTTTNPCGGIDGTFC